MARQTPESLVTANAYGLTNVKLAILDPGGRIPHDLQGHAFFVGPVGSVQSNGLPTADGVAILNGNGMIYRLDLDVRGEVRVTSRLTKTPCYYADDASKPGSIYAALGFVDTGIIRMSMKLGLRDELNTAFLPMSKPGELPRLLVTYDAGRPYEIDTQTLEVVTPVGWLREWKAALDDNEYPDWNVPFGMTFGTAHPGFDQERGEFIGVNYGRSVLNLLGTSLCFVPYVEDLPIGGGAADRLGEYLEESGDRARSAVATSSEALRTATVVKASSHAVQSATRTLRESAPAVVAERAPARPGLVLGSDFVRLLRWDGEGALENFDLVLPDGSPIRITQSIHQIGVTRNYVVLIDTAFAIELESFFNNPSPSNVPLARILRALLTRPQNPDTILYLVARKDLQPGGGTVQVKKLVFPLETIHFLVDFDDAGDRITLYAEHNAATDFAKWIRSYDKTPSGAPAEARLFGMTTTGEVDVSRLGRYVIDGLSGEILEAKVFSDVDRALTIGFYAFREGTGRLDNIYWQNFGLWDDLSTRFIDRLYADYPYRQLPLPTLQQMRAEGGRSPTLLRFNYPTMSIADCCVIDRHLPGAWLQSIQFVPRRGGTGGDTDGYIVATVAAPGGSEIWIFDAADLERGPLCRLGHPDLRFAFTVHNAWLPRIGPREASYLVPVRADYNPVVSRQPVSIRVFFETEVYPHFGP
jgi:carotenoid cleavage dioxygenase-like enzyme